MTTAVDKRAGAQAGTNDQIISSDDPFPVTPSDSADLAYVSWAVTLAVGGDLKVTTAAGNTVTLTLPAGQHSMRVVRIWSGGTTATGITVLP